MSFMFNPYPYEDRNPINTPQISGAAEQSVVSGPHRTAERLVEEIRNRLKTEETGITVCMDGYISAEWRNVVNLVAGRLAGCGMDVRSFDVSSCYKTASELDAILEDNLSVDRKRDPVLLFGKLFNGGFEALFDGTKLEGLCETLDSRKNNESCSKSVNIVYGAGSCFEGLRSVCDLAVYFDVTPKKTVLRIKNGEYRNLGDDRAKSFKATMRRCYYFDFELAMRLRMELVKNDLIDFYIASDDPENILLLPRQAFNEICESLVRYPFRCKPVYLEGIWGGYYVKNLRGLPDEMKNCAWVFDLIPLEVSLLVKAGGNIVEIPFFTFVCKEGDALMGKECVDVFGGYFPIRFNYDDTYHASGNMSIQVHPKDRYSKDEFNEHGRQDESYYVVAAGHGARTFIGLRDNADARDFIQVAKKSEMDFSPVDYEKHVNYVESKPGIQLLLPAGTIHSSGRNQVVLEIGSLTVGSYTFKMYDYLRPDLDGIPRPIHTYHGERALDAGRTASWVNENLVQKPVLVRSGDDWSEYLLGEHDLMYFSLYCYEFKKRVEGCTDGVFHVLTLVDGEKVAVYSADDPARRYIQKYLDVVVVPAITGRYVIENLGDQPVRVHKTCLKQNFRNYV